MAGCSLFQMARNWTTLALLKLWALAFGRPPTRTKVKLIHCPSFSERLWRPRATRAAGSSGGPCKTVINSTCQQTVAVAIVRAGRSYSDKQTNTRSQLKIDFSRSSFESNRCCDAAAFVSVPLGADLGLGRLSPSAAA